GAWTGVTGSTVDTTASSTERPLASAVVAKVSTTAATRRSVVPCHLMPAVVSHDRAGGTIACRGATQIGGWGRRRVLSGNRTPPSRLSVRRVRYSTISVPMPSEREAELVRPECEWKVVLLSILAASTPARRKISRTIALADPLS